MAHGITPTTIRKSLGRIIQVDYEGEASVGALLAAELEEEHVSAAALKKRMKETEKAMKAAAKALEFEAVAALRDKLSVLRDRLRAL